MKENIKKGRRRARDEESEEVVMPLEKRREAKGPALLRDPRRRCRVCDPCPCGGVSSRERLRMRKNDEYGCCVVKKKRRVPGDSMVPERSRFGLALEGPFCRILLGFKER